MPIECDVEFTTVDQMEFHEIDYRVADHRTITCKTLSR